MSAQWRIERAQVAITVDLDAFTAGDVVGGLLTIPIPGVSGGGFIHSIMLVDQDNEKAAFTLYFFSEKPASPLANDAAFAPAEAEAVNQIGSISLPAANYTSFSSNAYAIGRASGLDQVSNEYISWEYASAGAIYCYLVCTATPTYTAATDLILLVTMYLS